MPDKTNTLPDQVTEATRAFTQTLMLENNAFQGQLDNAISMTVDAMHHLITLCHQAVATGKSNASGPAQQNMVKTAQQALAEVQNATPPAPAPPATPSPVTEAVLDSALLHAVAQSYDNAVTAQQQMYITQQAAATQIISTIISLTTATLGVAVKNAETGGN